MVGVFSELCRHPKKRAVVDLDRRRCLLVVFCCSASRGGVGGGTISTATTQQNRTVAKPKIKKIEKSSQAGFVYGIPMLSP